MRVKAVEGATGDMPQEVLPAVFGWSRPVGDLRRLATELDAADLIGAVIAPAVVLDASRDRFLKATESR